jgi:hypothetical protein
MFMQNTRRTAALVAFALASTLIAGCTRSLTAPDSRRDIRSTEIAGHDDDPADCRSGYVIVGGHVVCN